MGFLIIAGVMVFLAAAFAAYRGEPSALSQSYDEPEQDRLLRLEREDEADRLQWLHQQQLQDDQMQSDAHSAHQHDGGTGFAPCNDDN